MDYEVTVGQLTFTSTTPLIMCFTVPIIDDAMSESTESFNVQLTQTLFAGVRTQQALVVIMDDDQGKLTLLYIPTLNVLYIMSISTLNCFSNIADQL